MEKKASKSPTESYEAGIIQLSQDAAHGAKELTKQAFGEQAMQKVLKTVKGMQVRPGPLANGQDLGLAAVTPTTVRVTRDTTAKAFGGSIPQTARVSLNELESLARGNRIVVPQRGDATSFLRANAPAAADVAMPTAPEHRKAFDALIKGHELAETQAKPSLAGQFHSHISPDVLLREHNMITTLPDHLKPAGQALREIRQPIEATDIYRATGLNLGKDPRVSRHARKHMTKMIDDHRTAESLREQQLVARKDLDGMVRQLEEREAATEALRKLGAAISPDAARRSMDRLDTLERNAPTAGQLGRYGAIGGLGGAAIGAVGNAIEGGSALKGATPKAKALNLVANAAKGALGGGALPLLRAHSDRSAEMNTLRKFVSQDKVAAEQRTFLQRMFAPTPLKKARRAEDQDHSERMQALGTGAAIGAGGAAYSTREALPRLLGSQLVYHGTDSGAARNILREGLQPSYGGTGGAAAEGVADWVNDSKGKVHVSTSKGVARSYAGRMAAQRSGKNSDFGAVFGALLPVDLPGGKTLSAGIPFEQFKQDFEVDPSMPHDGVPNAFRTSKPVPAAQVSRSNMVAAVKGRSRNLPSYIKNNPGRFGAGIGLAAAAPLLGYAGYHALKAMRNERNNYKGVLAQRKIEDSEKAAAVGAAPYQDDLLGKVGSVVAVVVKQAGLMQRLPQTLRALPSAAKNVALGTTEAGLHKNEIAGLGVLAVPGLDTMQASLRARLAGDKSHGAVEKRQLLGEGTHAALDVGGLGLLAAPAVAHLKHAFANSGYAGNVAQNGPGMKSHSQLPPFKVPELQVKVGGPLRRVGELVTGSKASRLREAAGRHTGKGAGKLRSLARAEEDRVGKVQGALVGATALGAVSDSTGLAEKVRDRKKEAGIGVGSGMTTSQYSGPLSYGPFKMTSGIPAFRRPAMTKRDESLEGAAWMYGENKEASMAATGAMSPAGKLTSSQRVGAPKTTGFAGPSIADVSKPKGFGTPMPGAQKNQI